MNKILILLAILSSPVMAQEKDLTACQASSEVTKYYRQGAFSFAEITDINGVKHYCVGYVYVADIETVNLVKVWLATSPVSYREAVKSMRDNYFATYPVPNL